MSISSIQRKNKTDEFIIKLTQLGIEPNNFELNNMLTEYFDNHIIGMPLYSPIKQIPYEESNKDNYNHNFITLKADLETAYKANIETNNKAVAIQQYYDTQSNKIRNAISNLSLRVDSILNAIKANAHIKYYSQSFDDLYSVEYYGDKKRNIPYTTSFVDLLQKKVYTDKTSNKNNKISLVNAEISINNYGDFDSHSVSGNKNNILNDTTTDIYIAYCKSKDDKAKSLELIIDLKTLIEINCVRLTFTSVKNMTCELYLSEDGENYISAYNMTSCNCVEWNFNSKIIRYIKINCIKNEPDGVESYNDDVAFYEYYYLLKNITISNDEFETKSVFVSKIIDFDDLTSIIRLDATDMTFNNTRIDYFIGFDNGIDKIGWDAITNHNDYKLFMFEKRHKILNHHIADYSNIAGDTNLYRLYELPKTVNRNSIKVTPGYNMWSVKRYNRKTGDRNDGFNLDSNDFTDYIEQCNVSQLFMDCENYSSFEIWSNVLYIFTQYISLDKADNLFNKSISIRSTDFKTIISSAQIKVFTNGYEVAPNDDNKYSFSLHKGVNKVQVVIYCPDNNSLQRRLVHNLNFKQLTNNVFGLVPMRYTNHNILNKMKQDTYNYYTIKDNYIYVKCNPSDLIKSDLEDMGYFLSYYALREDMTYYFPDNHIKFRLMAVFNSTDKNLSPELLNFKITGR